MKKVILTMACALAIGIAANAQSDSSYHKSGNAPGGSSQSQSKRHAYKMSDRETVQPNDVPPSLRQTLSDQRYNGWQNSTLYRDKASNEYYFDMKNGNSSTQYRFDQNGKAIPSRGGSYNGETAGSRSGSNK